MLDQIYNWIVQEITTNQFASGATLAAAAGSVVYYLKAWPLAIATYVSERVTRLIKYSVTIEGEDILHRYIDYWMLKNKNTKLRKVEIITQDNNLITFHENDWIRFWYRSRLITISKNKKQLENASSQRNAFTRTYHISGLFSKKVILKLLNEILEYGKIYEEEITRRKDNPSIFTYAEYGEISNVKSTPGKPFDKLFFQGKEDLVKDLEQFQENKERYKKLGVPYKRGYLFYGPPGNGKSSLAWAIAKKLQYDIYIVDLSHLTSAGFSRIMRSIPSHALVLIEDIDSFFNLREQVGENKVSFSTFLNVLSGVGQKSDIVTVITTNKIETIDPALLRASRCDYHLELVNPTPKIVKEYLEYIYEVTDIQMPPLPSISFSQIQEVVLQNIDDPYNCVKQLPKITLIQEENADNAVIYYESEESGTKSKLTNSFNTTTLNERRKEYPALI